MLEFVTRFPSFANSAVDIFVVYIVQTQLLAQISCGFFGRNNLNFLAQYIHHSLLDVGPKSIG